MYRKYKYYKQLDYMDCGPTCLKMVAAQYNKNYSIEYLRDNSYITRQGVSLLGLGEAAEKIGFRTLAAKLTFEQLEEEAPLPCILHWNQEHFVVLHAIEKANWFRKQDKFIIGDPGHDLVAIDANILKKCWFSTSDQKGIALLLEPTNDFYNKSEEKSIPKTGFRFLFQYLFPYQKYVFEIILGMVLGSLLSLVFPFLTQSMVDYGIQRQSYDFIHLILFSQLLLFMGSMAVDMIRNWILLHINARISISIISDFLMKLMRLPISFFESKNVGDITQRINDHKRIESFLTGSTLQTVFSIINLFVFSAVLGTYNIKFLLIFFLGSMLSVLWVLIFLKHRKELDYSRFQQMRENQNTLFELINGMQEIKLNDGERIRRWNWEKIQAKLFKVNLKSLALEQYQEIGYSIITQIKNILISYFAALAAIDNQISLGVMLSISYIVGQMNAPLSQLIVFIRNIQDAKMSLDRLSEIHGRQDEEFDDDGVSNKLKIDENEAVNFDDDTIKNLYLSETTIKPSVPKAQKKQGIFLKNVSFRYGAPNTPLILKNINLFIPEGKVTAIVGSSGSGKTTLLKILLKFFPTSSGEILVDGVNINELSAKAWRKKCGTVMQDGYIFSDTIARNIAVDGDKIDESSMYEAIKVSNIGEYVKKLPLGFTTKIGNSGSGLSGGQKQRLLIARVVYKQPKYIFFDEATSSLDANNEKIIMSNLETFFKGKTVVVIAHRLSTVKNADQILVLENGEIQEIGVHKDLVEQKGRYYELVKNQLELANS